MVEMSMSCISQVHEPNVSHVTVCLPITCHLYLWIRVSKTKEMKRHVPLS